MSIDLADVRSKWKSWLAQTASTNFSDADVVGFTADSNENTRDANRPGRRRMDFCAHLADGSYWRFHPGKRSSGDAQPPYFPSILQNDTGERGATEHAYQQWLTPGETDIWTLHHSQAVPQTDFIGKDRAWEIISSLFTQQAIPMHPTQIEITNGTLIPWSLWVCNLGRLRDRAIGNGIEKVFPSRTDEWEALFEFAQPDNTREYVFISQELSFGSARVKVRIAE